MIDIRTDTELLFTGSPEECEKFISRDKELMLTKKIAHIRGMNLGFLIGFITGASVAAVLILLFKLYN